MYDLKPLEEEWERYNKKKRLPIYVGIFSGFLLTSAILITLYNDGFSNINIAKVENNNSIEMSSNERITGYVSKNTEKNDLNNSILKEETKQNKPTDMIVDNIPILEDTRERENMEESNKPRKKIHLDIIASSSSEDYMDVEKRFFKSRDVDDSLFLAKAYYNIGKYKKSEFWALQTNKINSTIDQSWIIFAQSKVKLGQKNEAISILSDYIKRTGSERAKNSLLKIKTSN